jgi:hypothetical protein
MHQDLDERLFLLIVEHFRGDIANFLGYREEEWDAVNEHDVDAKCKVMVVFQNSLWNIVCHGAKAGDFPFE